MTGDSSDGLSAAASTLVSHLQLILGAAVRTGNVWRFWIESRPVELDVFEITDSEFGTFEAYRVSVIGAAPFHRRNSSFGRSTLAGHVEHVGLLPIHGDNVQSIPGLIKELLRDTHPDHPESPHQGIAFLMAQRPAGP
jgi:hypothetical protein